MRKGLVDLNRIIDEIDSDYERSDIDELILTLDKIRSKASKIGVSQRVFFHFFFKDFFDQEDTECYLNIKASVDSAYKRFAYKLNLSDDDEL